MTRNVPVCVAINTKNKFFCLATIHDANLLNTVVVNIFDGEGQVSLMSKVEFDSTCKIILEPLSCYSFLDAFAGLSYVECPVLEVL